MKRTVVVYYRAAVEWIPAVPYERSRAFAQELVDRNYKVRRAAWWRRRRLEARLLCGDEEACVCDGLREPVADTRCRVSLTFFRVLVERLHRNRPSQLFLPLRE